MLAYLTIYIHMPINRLVQSSQNIGTKFLLILKNFYLNTYKFS